MTIIYNVFNQIKIMYDIVYPCNRVVLVLIKHIVTCINATPETCFEKRKKQYLQDCQTTISVIHTETSSYSIHLMVVFIIAINHSSLKIFKCIEIEGQHNSE